MSLTSTINTYTGRFQVNPPCFLHPPKEDVCLIIAIPAYKEPNITTTLESLAKCQQPSGTVEIIITINAPENASFAALETNKYCVKQIEDWLLVKPEFLEVLVIKEESLPQKHAGAGLARKIGMDEAAQRWAAVEKDGPIVCLDADCTVSENYLMEAEKAFQDKKIEVAHFHFEHNYQQETDKTLQKGIINYELHLRLYVRGLRQAGFAHAVHTVGSSMAVRASRYAKSGGMNKRKAGEDFYFLHKLVVNSGWKNITKATVYPSCRVSDRVPFGTGRAQMEWVEAGVGETYNSEIYEVMKPLFTGVESYYTTGLVLNYIQPVNDFLQSVDAINKLEEIKKKSISMDVFTKHFWQWMDGFMVMKLTHYLRDNGFPNQAVLMCAIELLAKNDGNSVTTLEEALEQFRVVDKAY